MYNHFDKTFPNITGGLYTIAFKPYLSANGKRDFETSLLSWRTRTASRVDFKRVSMNTCEQQSEYCWELEASNGDGLAHNLDFGPVSLVQSQVDLDLIDHALEYLHGHDEVRDDELYYRLQREYLLKRTTDDEESQYPLIEENNEALCEIFNLYRLAQFDLLTPFEQKMLVHKVRKTEPSFSYDPLGLHRDPIKNIAARRERVAMEKTRSVDAVFEMHATSFLVLQRNAPAVLEPENVSSADFKAMAKAGQSFEMLQLLLYSSFADDITFGKIEREPVQTTISSVEYALYFEQYTPVARMSLQYPETIATKRDDPFAYDDFTTHIYGRDMTDKGRAGFDAVLQSRIDNVAQKLRYGTVDVGAFRQKAINYRQPKF